MISGLPRPAIAGSASCAPASASLRISGSGLISVFIGMKPETMVPGVIATGNGRAAIVSAAACRSPPATRRARERVAAQFGSWRHDVGPACTQQLEGAGIRDLIASALRSDHGRRYARTGEEKCGAAMAVGA